MILIMNNADKNFILKKYIKIVNVNILIMLKVVQSMLNIIIKFIKWTIMRNCVQIVNSMILIL